MYGSNGTYRRYHIQTQPAPEITPWPSKFKVHVRKMGLAKLLVKEMIQYMGDWSVVLSRPCVYGVFSGPAGGFAPREELCVGCLRCTTQYPEWVSISPNPERLRLGDSFFTYEYVEAVAYEAFGGSIPVKGAGYRGSFGGEGWDGMWTDMSEIVRPTRDGIHGREFISTAVDIGAKPNFLEFDREGQPVGEVPHTFSIPIPMVFDVPPNCASSSTFAKLLSQAAEEIETLSIIPIERLLYENLRGDHLVPLVTPSERERVRILPTQPRLIEMDGWEERLYREIRVKIPEAEVCLRIPFTSGEDLLQFYQAGLRVFHLIADYHGRSPDGMFVYDLIRSAHQTFVERGVREEVTLLGSGGIIGAEHVPKAIIAGLDAVALDTPILVALQARFDGEFTNRNSKGLRFPKNLTPDWGAQRLKNLTAAWRDQLLEVLGAMGLREVRRLRGEIGRAMFQEELEREAFAGIEGYPYSSE